LPEAQEPKELRFEDQCDPGRYRLQILSFRDLRVPRCRKVARLFFVADNSSLWLYPAGGVTGGWEMSTTTTEKKPYVRPTLKRREKLNEVTAVTIVSGKGPI
jgi:hypothetical protein